MIFIRVLFKCEGVVSFHGSVVFRPHFNSHFDCNVVCVRFRTIYNALLVTSPNYL